MAKTRQEMLLELVAKLAEAEHGDGMQQAEEGQDRNDLVHELAIEVIGGKGFVGQDADSDNSEFEELVEFLTKNVVYQPARWVVKEGP